MSLTCSKCGECIEAGKRVCVDCRKARKKQYLSDRYKAGKRTMYNVPCLACSTIYLSFKKEPKFCHTCRELRKQYLSEGKTSNLYKHFNGRSCESGKFRHIHRRVAEDLLGRELNRSEVVHHVNCNPLDNSITNLMVIDISSHSKLHQHLVTQRVIIEKSMNENPGNCWDSLIAPMTTAWLETTGAKVIKLWEIGQSAAEPLLNEEGSETKLRTPNH